MRIAQKERILQGKEKSFHRTTELFHWLILLSPMLLCISTQSLKQMHTHFLNYSFDEPYRENSTFPPEICVA